jgi:hypothetical protein
MIKFLLRAELASVDYLASDVQKEKFDYTWETKIIINGEVQTVKATAEVSLYTITFDSLDKLYRFIESHGEIHIYSADPTRDLKQGGEYVRIQTMFVGKEED